MIILRPWLRKLNNILVFIFFFVFFILNDIIICSAKMVHIEWSYSGQAKEYYLYLNNTKVYSLPGQNTSFDMELNIDTSIENYFVLSAVDMNNTESPTSPIYTVHSDSYIPPTTTTTSTQPTTTTPSTSLTLPTTTTTQLNYNKLPIFIQEFNNTNIVKKINYTWEYSNLNDILGFKLYYNGIVVADVKNKDIREYSVLMPLSSIQDNYFYITSYNNNTESNPSNFLKIEKVIIPESPNNLQIRSE